MLHLSSVVRQKMTQPLPGSWIAKETSMRRLRGNLEKKVIKNWRKRSGSARDKRLPILRIPRIPTQLLSLARRGVAQEPQIEITITKLPKRLRLKTVWRASCRKLPLKWLKWLNKSQCAIPRLKIKMVLLLLSTLTPWGFQRLKTPPQERETTSHKTLFSALKWMVEIFSERTNNPDYRTRPQWRIK